MSLEVIMVKIQIDGKNYEVKPDRNLLRDLSCTWI